jgi:hypothetical protein
VPNIAVFRRYIEVRKRSPQHLQVHFILLYVASPICWHHVPFMHPRNIIFSPLRPLGLRSDVIRSLVLRTTPACIASYPWRMTD